MNNAEHTTKLETWVRDWWVLLLLGIIALVVGVFAILWPFVSGVAFTAIFGIILIIASVVTLVHTIRMKKEAWGIILGLLISLVYAAGGLLLLSYPVRGLFIATVVLGITFTLQGIFQTAESLERIGRTGWGWRFVGAILTLILGIWILAALPYSALWALGIVVGVNLLFVGIALITELTVLHHLEAPMMATG